jgi:hypothetical protein
VTVRVESPLPQHIGYPEASDQLVRLAAVVAVAGGVSAFAG